jgi:fructokinase
MTDLVAFGEVLWDDYGSEKILGGAPLNVCIHAKKLGVSVCMMTAVGSDDSGKEILRQVENYDVELLHQVNDKPTGRAEVMLDESHKPHFFLEPDSAYDVINLNDRMLEISAKAKVFYFGSLAQRSRVSRTTLADLLDNTDALKVYDVNLRKGIENDREILEKSLPKTDILKVNEKEFARLLELFSEEKDEEDGAKDLMEKYGIQKLFITRDASGATLYSDGKRLTQKSPEKTVVDTTGCGDAFTASVIASLLKGEDDEQMLKNALQFSAKTATYKGAVPHLGHPLST